MPRRAARGLPFALVAVCLAVTFLGALFSNVVEATSGPNLVEPNGSISVSSRLVFQNPRGQQRYYAFFYAPGGSTWSYKFSSDGVVWTSGAEGIAGTLGSASVWIFDAGTELVVHFVASGTAYGSIMYRRGTIADSSQAITWGTLQTVEPGGQNAGAFGLGVSRTTNGRPVITAVREMFTNSTYRYEVWAWGADRDVASPAWTRALLMPSVSAVPRETRGFTSVYSAGVDYVFVAASFILASGWNEAWVRAAWNAVSWSVGPVTVLSSSDQTPRHPSLIVDQLLFPHCLLMPTPVGGKGGLVHLRGKSQDGTLFETFSLTPGPLTSATLSIDLASTPTRLKAIYHYETAGFPVSARIYWRDGPTDTMTWGPENYIQWNGYAQYLSSSQRDFVGHIHGLLYNPGGTEGVYYFNI